MAVGAVPHRDAVAPPELPRDVPVAQAVQPLDVRALPSLGPERDPAVERGLLRRAPQPIDRDEPLQARDPRLDLAVAAVAVADGVHVRPDLLDDQVQLLQLLAHRGARVVPPEPVELLRRVLVDRRVGAEDVHEREPGPLRDLEVGRVVRRRDLHGAGPERRVDRGVGDDRDLPAVERMPNGPADQGRVPFVVRMHRDPGVAEHRLDARGRARRSTRCRPTGGSGT